MHTRAYGGQIVPASFQPYSWHVSYRLPEWENRSDAEVAERGEKEFGAAQFEMQRRFLLAVADLRAELEKARHLAWALALLTAGLLIVTIVLAIEAA